MATIQPEKKVDSKVDHKVDQRTETSLVGTAIGVGYVGLVILISYITLYALYMARV